MNYLNPLDAAFLRMETKRTPMHVAGLMVFRTPDGAPVSYVRDLHEHMRSMPVSRPPFNYRLSRGRLSRLAPRWEHEPSVDIDYHLRHSALPRPGGERELGILVSRLHSQHMDLDRPLWECHLIEGLENNRFAIYLKLHHSAVDGMTALEMINQWLSADPKADPAAGPWAMPETHQKRKQLHRNLLSFGAHFVKENLDGATELTRALYGMLRTPNHPEGSIGRPADTPRTIFNNHINQQRRLATQLYDLSHLKSLSKTLNCTINDLCLTICGGALRKYLMEFKALPGKTLVASVPIGLPHPNGQPGNRVAGFVCPIGTHLSDPLDRLKIIQAVTTDTKEKMKDLSDAALSQFALLGISPLLLGQISGLVFRIPPLFNLTISNVIGSSAPLYLKGAELEALYPMSVLFDGHTLNITVVGYAGRLCVGVTGCRDNNPSLQKLALYIGDALAELETAAAIHLGKKTGRQTNRGSTKKKRTADIIH